MKDRKIDYALAAYAETVKPKADKVLPAVYRRLANAARNPVPTKKRHSLAAIMGGTGLSAVAAALVVVFVLTLIGVLSFPDNSGNSIFPPPPPYALANLTQARATEETVSQWSGLMPSVQGSETIYSVFTQDNEIFVVTQRGRFVAPGGGMVEYIAYIDLKGGLTDYKKFSNLPNRVNGARYSEEFDDGEWHTNLFYKRNDAFIYIIAMSPNQGAANLLTGGN